MKANTSITIDEHVLDRVREVSNGNISSFMERAARHELMYLAGQAVTEWERRRGNDVEARALADLELQQAAMGQVRETER